MGKVIALTIEATETILLIEKTVTQIPKDDKTTHIKPLIFNVKASITPKVVATPFPPLKLRNTGQL